MDDMHVEAFTWDNYAFTPATGEYYPQIVVRHIPGKYIIVKSGISGISVGDELTGVNGLTTKQWEDSLRPYLSVGDSSAFFSEVPFYMMGQQSGSNITLTTVDTLNNSHLTTSICNTWTNSSWIRGYYPNDTLANVQWRYWGNCNIGYVNVGKMQDAGSDVANMYAALQNTNAIIFDVRNYPASLAVWDFIAHYLFPSVTLIQKSMNPDTNYPGTFYWENSYGYSGNYSNYYKGKVIVLFNEQTISEAKSMAMVLGEWTNAVTIGSQTDGTDFAVTYYNLSQQMGTGFTSQGAFYPNGNTIERVGIIPDSEAYPTQAGIRHGRDEVLEKALEVAGCPLSVENINEPVPSLTIFPNPSYDKIQIEADNINTNRAL